MMNKSSAKTYSDYAVHPGVKKLFNLWQRRKWSVRDYTRKRPFKTRAYALTAYKASS